MKSIFATIILFLTAFTLPSQANVNEPRCSGKSILGSERKKDPARYDASMALAKKIPNGEAIFWRIEKPGSDKVSWLFGTIHITDERVNLLAPETKKALLSAKTVALELAEIGNKGASMRGLMDNLTLVALKPGENLWDLLGPKKSKIVIDELARRGLPNGMFAGMQPYVVAMMIGVPLCEMARVKSGRKALDARLAAMAKQHNIKVVGLETIKEQLIAMSSMTIKTQQAFLLQTAEYGKASKDIFETMIQLYLQRKMNIMFGLMKMQGTDGVAEHFIRTLLKKRNHLMVKRALPLVEKGGAFIGVGALHLVGKDGLVSLFRQQGFKLVPIN